MTYAQTNLMQLADNAGLDQQADLGLHCHLTEAMDIFVYVDEQKVSTSFCTGTHAHLELRCSHIVYSLRIKCKLQAETRMWLYLQYCKGKLMINGCRSSKMAYVTLLFVCVEVLWPSSPNGVMSSAVSLPNHTFTWQA